MKTATAKFLNGRVELTSPVDWPDGTQVEVRPVNAGLPQRHSWLSLPPLNVGQFQEPTSDDDLLAEMLDDSGS